MKKYIYIIFISAFSILLIILYFSVSNQKMQRQEIARHKHNINVLNKNYVSYKTAFGHSVAKVEALDYKVEDMKKYESELLKTIKELKLKPGNVISATEIITETKTEIKTVIQYVDSLKCLNYSDKWNTVSGCFKGDSIDLNIESRDSLNTIVSRIPKYKFLWFKWGTKAIEFNIISQNPNTKFSYIKYIELK